MSALFNLGFAGTVALVVLAACSGKTQGAPDGGGGSCVDLSLSSFDRSCQKDSDCTTVTVGHLCADSCLCGGATINVRSEPAWQQQVQGLGQGDCPCPADLPPRCVGGTCTVCTDPQSCGLSSSDAGASDASTSPADAAVPRCVTIPPTTYSTTCKVNADCTSLPSGQVCSGQCNCGGMPVNVSGVPAYTAATQGLTFADCPCALQPIACVAGTCIVCGAPAACGDGG